MKCRHDGEKKAGWDEVTCRKCGWIVPSGQRIGIHDGWFPSHDAHKEFKKYRTYTGMDNTYPIDVTKYDEVQNMTQNNEREAFEKWLKENYPDYPPPLSEVWQAATQASESEINSLKERVAELESELFVLQELRKNQATLGLELTASNNQLRGLCEKIYADLQRGNACRDTMDNLHLALSSTPAQSLAEHDNEVIEKCGQTVAKYANLQPIADEIRALKATP